MKDPLLDFYERELGFIREEGREDLRLSLAILAS